eukprot:6609453-Lingulodinium_polyedra.AAC.1
MSSPLLLRNACTTNDNGNEPDVRVRGGGAYPPRPVHPRFVLRGYAIANNAVAALLRPPSTAAGELPRL